jgi:CIC family chloride channel protein
MWARALAVTRREITAHGPLGGLVQITLVGVITGAAVVVLEELVEESLRHVLGAEAWVIAGVLILGAVAAAMIVHFFGGGSSSTTDVYISQFHDVPPSVEAKYAPGRLGAALASLGSGAPLGLEGPAVYVGAVFATLFRRWWPFRGAAGLNALMVAGAAAGVAAVFKAPAAAAIFAIEVPHRTSFREERLLPALLGAAAGYLTLTAIVGTEPLLPIPPVELTFQRALGALVIGALVGLVARFVIFLIRAAEELSGRGHWLLRGASAGIVLAVLFVLGRALTGEDVAITSGFSTAEWSLEPDHALWLLATVLLIRALGTSGAIAGGGVGGLFVPLLATGMVVGRMFADATDPEELSLYVVIGGAAMLGAGYGAPVTGVIFVAEVTGQPEVIVPGILAMTTAILTVGPRSVSPAQQP